jgi:hypothetical protein
MVAAALRRQQTAVCVPEELIPFVITVVSDL